MALNQSWLPVRSQNGSIVGFFAIANTPFVGNETTFALAAGSVPVKKVSGKDASGNGKTLYKRQEELMVTDFSWSQCKNKVWESYAEFVPMSDVMPNTDWVQSPVVGGRQNNVRGLMFEGLINGRTNVIQANPGALPAVTTSAVSMVLEANAPFQNVPSQRYFDFNWVDVFSVQYPDFVPATLQILTNPAVPLKAFLIGSAQPMNKAITLNTVRIVKTQNVQLAAGPHAFTFRVTGSGNLSPMNAPTLSQSGTGGTLGAATYAYRVSAILPGGESMASIEKTIVVASGTTNKITLTWTAVQGATGYYVYGRTSGATKRLITPGNVLTIDDTGAATPSSIDPRITNTVDVTLNVTISATPNGTMY